MRKRFSRGVPSKTNDIPSSFMLARITILVSFLIMWGYNLYAQEDDGLSADSKPQPNVPKGEIKGPFIWKSQIYPGTEREYWLYIPQQYQATKPACVMLVQDGLSCAEGWHLPTVLDNLIDKKQVPVMIGIFVKWGQVPGNESDNYPRFNRSFEYDGLGDRYARFLIEELLPEVSKNYNLSSNPDDRCIAGASSGAICAFNAAWERPDAFRRVFSSIGTYVGLRGADVFPTLVRKMEPKPLRVFLQDGSKDLNIYAGDWYIANADMLSALQYAGYEVNHIWGEGGHNSKHTAVILPYALRWLWKDYPMPVTNHKNLNVDRRVDLLIEGQSWEPVSTDGHPVNQVAVNKEGELFFADTQTGVVFKRDTSGQISQFAQTKSKINGMMFGANEKLYVGDKKQKRIIACAPSGKIETIVKNVNCTNLAVSRKGIYFTEREKNQVGFYDFTSGKTHFFTGVNQPSGLSLSAEQTFLNVGSESEGYGYSFKIQQEGKLAFAQPYIHYHIPYGYNLSGASHMAIDADNLLYTTTQMGIQVSDQLGRVNFIFARLTNEPDTDIAFAGSNFDELIIASGHKLFKRKLKAKGILSWLSPVKPPKPGL